MRNSLRCFANARTVAVDYVPREAPIDSPAYGDLQELGCVDHSFFNKRSRYKTRDSGLPTLVSALTAAKRQQRFG
jgi:hypothetical protein